MNHEQDPSSSSSTAGTSSANDQQQQQQPSTVLAYPLPPLQYVNNIDPDNLPTPPAPITEGFYHMFGQKISLDDAIIAPLEAHGTKRLYPRTEYDHKKELKKINASILVNFLDLIDVLIECPDTDKRIEKCNDIATLFINFHHLINELRPHQARETLRVWLNTQRKSREDITKKLNAEIDETNKVLQEYLEFEEANKPESIPSSSKECDGDKQQTQSSSSTNNQPNNSSVISSVDDIMCEIVDETCSQY